MTHHHVNIKGNDSSRQTVQVIRAIIQTYCSRQFI